MTENVSITIIPINNDILFILKKIQIIRKRFKFDEYYYFLTKQYILIIVLICNLSRYYENCI